MLGFLFITAAHIVVWKAVMFYPVIYLFFIHFRQPNLGPYGDGSCWNLACWLEVGV